MSFLGQLALAVCQWLLTKAGEALVKIFNKMRRRKKIDDEAQASVQPMKDAKTGAETDEATDSDLNGI